MSGSAAPDLLDSEEYGRAYASVTAEDGTPAFPLRDAARMARVYQDLVVRLVVERAAAGWTWREIGAEMGVSRQAAQQLAARYAAGYRSR